MTAGQGTHRRLDEAARKALCANVELAELIGRDIPLKRVGKEFSARCPFHDERSPSFTVVPHKGFFQCFGCGANGDALGWLIDYHRMEFIEACKTLDARAFDALPAPKAVPPAALPRLPEGARWIPLTPVPDGACALLRDDGWTIEVWNPKAIVKGADAPGAFRRYHPNRCDAYRDAAGRLLGYVLRLDIIDRDTKRPKKIPLTVTWCVGPEGEQRWCVQHFAAPRPLFGLDALAAKPFAPVLVVEGEKCRAAGACALTPYAVVSWPGGSKGLAFVDWSALRDRDVVLWPDADEPGRQAMLGWIDHSGVLHRGVAQLAHRAGARSLRYVDTEGQPKGWDIADALLDEGWSARQLAAWAANRVVDLDVRTDEQRCAR